MADTEPAMSPEGGEDLAAFLRLYWRDRESGGVRSLDEYVSLFPRLETPIASEYLALARIVGDESAPIKPGKPETADDQVVPTAIPAAGLGDDTITAIPALTPREPTTTEGQIGPYVLSRILGHGSQGAVWLAEDTRFNCKVALKVLSLTEPGSEIFLPRFQREAQIAARLDHPGICAVHDSGVIGGVPYVAMRYVDGRTLGQLIATASGPDGADAFLVAREVGAGPSHDSESHDETRSSAVGGDGVDAVVAILEKAANALHAAHQAGIVHRDIKPSNIMVTPHGQPVILDFGLAQDLGRDAARLTASGEWFGAPAYMAPEQLEPDPRVVDRRADVWALGVCLYEALALRPPFAAATRAQLMTAIFERAPVPAARLNPAIGRDLEVVLETCLHKDADTRYASAHDLAEDLRRVRAALPILARPLPPLLRFGRWTRRYPGRAGLLATALVLTPVLSVLLSFMVTTSSERAAGRQLLLSQTIEDHLERGFYELGEGSDAVALGAFVDALALDPDSPEANAGQILALLESGRPSDALIRLDLAPDPEALARVRIEVLDALGRTADAESLRARRKPPETAERAFVAGLVEMSRAYRGAHDAFKTAVAHLTTAVQAWPGQPRRSWHVAWLHAIGHAGTRAERDRASLVALGLWPGAPTVWRSASFALAKHAPKRALALCERFLAVYPHDVSIRARLASTLSATGELDRARTLAEAIAKGNPTLAGPLLTLAHVHQIEGNFSEALHYHQAAHRLSGASVVANQQIAALLMRIDEAGNVGEAERYLRAADGIEPNVSVRIHLAYCCLIQDRGDEALDWYQKASEVAPEHPGVWVTLFKMYRGAGRFEEALDAARRAYVYEGRESQWPIREWLVTTESKVVAARRLDAVLRGESAIRNPTDFAALLEVAETRSPEVVISLWDRARLHPDMTAARRATLEPAVARAAARAAARGSSNPGPWLDRVLSLLETEFRVAATLAPADRVQVLRSLIAPPDFATLLDPAFYGDEDEARRISMLRFFTRVRKALGSVSNTLP